MRELNYYVALLMEQELEAVKSRVERDAISDIADIIADWDEQDLYAVLEDTDCMDGIHKMDELDDVFDCMSPTEVLEELSEIDLCDDWFNEYSKTSSCDLLDIIGIDARDIARDIYNEVLEVSDDDIFDIYEDAQVIINAVEAQAKKVSTARALLEDMILSNNVDDAISALWNINA